MQGTKNRRFALLLSIGVWLLFTSGLTHLSAAAPLDQDCSSYIGPAVLVHGKSVGPKTCNISQEKQIHNVHGVPYRRLEIGVSGTIVGYTAKESPRVEMLTDVPEFTAQRGNLGPYFHGIGTYFAEKGSGLTLFLPGASDDWNGKLFVLIHGSGSYGTVGDLISRKPNQYNPLMGENSYAGLMIDKGYAVAYTSRPASRVGSADEEVTLDGGEVTLGGRSYGYHLGIIRDWTQIAKNLLEAQLGSKPSRTYLYGHSAGASLGRLFNYAPGRNLDAYGEKIFDGMLLDDAGGGWYWPTQYFVRTQDSGEQFLLKEDDRDHLEFDQAHRDNFALQLDIVHQAYSGGGFVVGEYLSVKRENARLLGKKGLGAKSRTYEIIGVSHGDAGSVWPSELYSQNLDLSGVYDSLIDVLDQWVEQGIEPGPTRSDDYQLGDANGDGQLENPAVALPEIACPTGVYYEFPPGVSRPGRTGFTPYLKTPQRPVNADTTPLPPDFEENWLEPLDSRGYLVDMNKNHIRDTRPSITQAWRRRAREGERYGILGPERVLTHDRYVSCVSRVASELLDQRLISESAMLHYIQAAIASDIGKETSAKAESPFIGQDPR